MSGVNHPAWAEDQLGAMFSFLMMGKQKANVPVLIENLEKLRHFAVELDIIAEGYRAQTVN